MNAAARRHRDDALDPVAAHAVDAVVQVADRAGVIGNDGHPLADARAKFAAHGITKDKTVVAYCGGGISATIDLFLLHQLGYDRLTLYDGSMGEWAKDPALPIETDRG